MLDEQGKALAVAIRTNASLRLRFNAPLRIQASATAFLESVKDEDVFGYITIPLAHLRVCWASLEGERPTIDSDAALSRAAIQLMKAAIVNGEKISNEDTTKPPDLRPLWKKPPAAGL